MKSFYHDQMIDFSSSLYLDMKHPHAELTAWDQLTTGKPAAFAESEFAGVVAKKIASLQGYPLAVCAPSTLHLYQDLFGYLKNKNVILFVDEKIYPVSLHGIELLKDKHIPVFSFRHLDADDLEEKMRRNARKNYSPVVLTDGWCPDCGMHAPLKNYVSLLNDNDGWLIMDDTQAFGILGDRSIKTGYGSGGGGLAPWLNVSPNRIITIVSLAKSFGVPMTVLSGDKKFVREFKEDSSSRIYSSPVSNAHLLAALNAIRINNDSGDKRRNDLLKNVLQLRSELRYAGIDLNGGIFPVQSIRNLSPGETISLYKKLEAARIQTVLVQSHHTNLPAISIVLRCDHSLEELKALAVAIKRNCPLRVGKEVVE